MMHMLMNVMTGLTVLTLSLACAPRTHADEPKDHADVLLSKQAGPLRIGIIGMDHGHIEGLLWNATHRDDMVIVGISEPNRALFDRLAAKYILEASLYYATTEAMLNATKPEAVSVMGPISGHRAAVEACAARGVHTLLEKPLAYSSEDAKAIQEAARAHKVLVLTNFETSWYASVREAKRLADSGEHGTLRKMIFRHGHKGPKEIGCSAEFLAWLTDPTKNGGGAIVDFGCYGAVIATWMMDGTRPSSIKASATTLKPAAYPHVDDDATIVLTYPGKETRVGATAVIEASWAWTHDNKEMDLYLDGWSLHAGKWDDLAMRQENAGPTKVQPAAKPKNLENEWSYLKAVVRGECAVDPLSSLEYNVVVAEILDEARRQVQPK
ncbi:MAG: Gfo/Idh/MocA family oxidoreductase [Phycisphaerales bacterium]|nr:MAG: Gfo/Idh/MocA family oxidoreductase [Phycisphaerales bacterium]